MEHLDVSSFKLVRVAAVDDDDLLHQGAVLTRERILHLGGEDIHWFLHCNATRRIGRGAHTARGAGLTTSPVMYLMSWSLPPTVGRPNC